MELTKKRSLWGYKGDDWVSFIKITVADQRSLPKVRDKSCFTHYGFSHGLTKRTLHGS